MIAEKLDHLRQQNTRCQVNLADLRSTLPLTTLMVVRVAVH